MNATVLELIAEAICDRIEPITAGADYSVTVAEVVRPGRDDAVLDDLFVVVSQAEADEPTVIPGNPAALEFTQTFDLDLIRRPSDASSVSGDELLNAFEADVVKAVCQPQLSWQSFGGLAVNAAWGRRAAIATDGVLVGRTLPLIVIYRTNETDLTVAR